MVSIHGHSLFWQSDLFHWGVMSSSTMHNGKRFAVAASYL